MKTTGLTTGQAWDAVADAKVEVYAKSDLRFGSCVLIRRVGNTTGFSCIDSQIRLDSDRRWSLYYTATDLPVPEPDELTGAEFASVCKAPGEWLMSNERGQVGPVDSIANTVSAFTSANARYRRIVTAANPASHAFDATPGRALRYDEVQAALDAGCVVETRSSECKDNPEYGKWYHTEAIMQNWTYRIAPAAETKPAKEPPAESAVISGPSAIATVYRDGKPEEWEARDNIRNSNPWEPRAVWGIWDLGAIDRIEFRRRPDPFAGIELPEGYRVEPGATAGVACLTLNAAGHSETILVTDNVDLYEETFQQISTELAIAKRLRELEQSK